jgi:hypothetical protein
MDGKYKRISYQTYPPDCSLFDPANIQMVNLKSKYHPFTIVKEGNVEIKPYYMPMDDHRNLDSTMFITWPRRGKFKNGDYTSALSHVIKWGWHEKTEKTLTQIYLIGMLNDPKEQQRVDKLVTLAKNWQYAPELILESNGYRYEGYEIKEKAYILTNTLDNNELRLSIKASDERPLINPAFVLKDVKEDKPFKIMINNRESTNHRAGFEDSSLVIWIPITAMQDISLKVLF